LKFGSSNDCFLHSGNYILGIEKGPKRVYPILWKLITLIINYEKTKELCYYLYWVSYYKTVYKTLLRFEIFSQKMEK